MPTLKTEILGSLIEINYEELEKDKLRKIIERFNNRLLDFENLRGKISDKKILILAALKAEDQIIDSTLTKEKEEEIINKLKKSLNINDITQEIIQLKDIKNKLNIENNELKNLISKAFNELNKIEEHIIDLTDQIISQSHD
jgi:cell division protein ZapA (FtsZ GTPase activity inhibitor)|tara:strand:+ start:19 stop:444 length:426 start_codon:yes stop_codon:yes gene_type:complete